MEDFADSVAQLSFFTDSSVFTYRRGGATLAQTDRFAYDGNLSMRNADPQAKSITVSTILIIDSTAEKTYTISDCALTQNDSMRFAKAGDDDYRIVNVGPPKTYGLRIEHGSATANRLFIQPTVSLSATSSHIIVPNWNKLYEPIRIYIDHGNNGTIDDSILVQNTVDVEERGELGVPKEFGLGQNYPNPFNPETQIEFSLPTRQRVTLRIFDVLGRQVRVLLDEVREAGNHRVVFDGTALSSGVYFYQLRAGDRMQVRKMLLIR